MKEQKKNPNSRIKNKILPDINLDSYLFKKMQNSVFTSKDKFFKQNDLNLSNDENKKYFSVINDYDMISGRINSLNNNNNNQKNSLDNINQKNVNPLLVYEEIKSHIEQFISNYITEKASVSSALKEILNTTIIIIKDFIDNKHNNSLLNDNTQNLNMTYDGERQVDGGRGTKNSLNINSSYELDINSKIVFILKIQKLNDRIKTLLEENEFYKNMIKFEKKNEGKNLIEIFKKKFMEYKAKNKKAELQYLFFIKELEKKINSLENELRKKIKENLPIDTIKKLRCFPYFHQYDFKEDINPKSIPLFQQFQQYRAVKSLKKKSNSNSFKNKKVLIGNNSSDNGNKLFITNPESEITRPKIKNNLFETRIDKRNLNKIKKNSKSTNNYSYNYINNDENIFNYSPKNINNLNLETNIINDTEQNDQNKLYKYIKEFQPKTILDNKREYFLAHPNLNIAIAFKKKKDNKYVAMPKKLLKFKVHKSLEKNALFTFPSSLNETLVNLEKLRKYRNIKVKESENI